MKKEINQKVVWDAIAEQWFHFRQKPFPDVAKWLERLSKEWKKEKKGKGKEEGKGKEKERPKILEIGCGNCRNLLIFAKEGFECYGIDFSKKMLEYAKKFAEKYGFKVKLKQADATALPFPDESFDYALCIATLHHIQGRENQIKAIKEMKRVLKKNGQAFISVWNKLSWNWFFKPKEVYVPWHIKGKTYMRYYYLFWPWGLEKLLKHVGFSINARQWFGKNLCFLVRKN